MVYENLYLMRGIILNFDEAINLAKELKIDVKDEIETAKENIHFGIYELSSKIEKKLKLICHPNSQMDCKIWSCCTKVTDSLIIGKVLKKYERVYDSCPDCEEYSCCDVCIGKTVNGIYDVNKIQDSIVTCSENKICTKCYHDKYNDGKCDRCELVSDGVHLTARDMFVKEDHQNLIEQIKPMQYVYIIDDCLWCT